MKTILFFGSIILMLSCGQAEAPAHADSTNPLTTQPDTAIQQPIAADTHPAKDTNTAPQTAETPAPKKEVTVNEGIVYYMLPYCGGARPTEEIIAEKKKSRLLTNSTLKLKNKAGVEYLVVTNDKGIFRSGIPAGVYDVYLTEKTNKELYNVSPETCENCLTKVMSYVEIRNGQQASFVIQFACGPDDYKRP
jgi:hypothetical protein